VNLVGVSLSILIQIIMSNQTVDIKYLKTNSKYINNCNYTKHDSLAPQTLEIYGSYFTESQGRIHLYASLYNNICFCVVLVKLDLENWEENISLSSLYQSLWSQGKNPQPFESKWIISDVAKNWPNEKKAIFVELKQDFLKDWNFNSKRLKTCLLKVEN